MNLGTFNLPMTPAVMGILNLTQDSFYDVGAYTTVDAALLHGERMVLEGAAIIDVGAESNRPGANKTSIQEELDRVIPVIELLSKRVATPISISTSNPEVMQDAVKAGAKMINDIRALAKPGAISMAAKLGVPITLMHMQNDPGAMHAAPNSHDLVTEVYQFLESRITTCVKEGIDSKKIIIDPGFGFGKNLQQNLTLLRSLEVFTRLQKPLLVGISNKSMIGQILDVAVDQRVYGNLTAAVIAIGKGANIIRAHNVQATADAIKVFKAVAGV